MQLRVSVGAAFNIYHSSPTYQSDKKRRRKARQLMQVFDEFSGKITGVNFNGIKVLDLFANGECFGPKRAAYDSNLVRSLLVYLLNLAS